jgi:hypothetical protein
MMLRSARITLKQHRFEIGAAAVFAVLLGVAALVVSYRLTSIVVPAGCFDSWLTNGGEGGGACDGPVRAFAAINEDEAGKVLALMAVLPFAAGLLGGVTLVGRELESRTAQTAWALSASRVRWFARQVWPLLLIVVATVSFASLAAGVLEGIRQPWYHSSYSDRDLFGPVVVARAIGALGVGLFAGAVLGRTLPAFLVGIVVAVGLAVAVAAGEASWIASQPRVTQPTSSINQDFVYIDETGWQSPDGTIVDDGSAAGLAPQDGTDPYAWLLDHGYVQVARGVTQEQAKGWLPIAIGIWLTGGVVLIAVTAWVIDRRRPT